MRSNERILVSLFVVSLALGAQAQTPPPPNTECGEGELEANQLTAAEWSGADGTFPAGSSIPTTSFSFFGLRSPHQTLVAKTADPLAPIDTAAGVGQSGNPNGSHFAVQLGNSQVNRGNERLSKTFLVTKKKFTFSYAVVLQDPDHPLNDKPSFQVVVKDASGTVIANAVNLGNGSGVLSSNDPFLAPSPTTPGVKYRNWSCVEIDLSNYLGKVVTVEFITKDCSQGGHYGYAYIDNICGTCSDPNDPAGSIAFDRASSTDCGRGKICYKYTLPAAGGKTGSVSIKLDIVQNGFVVYSTTQLQTSGTSYCFPIDPHNTPGVSLAAGGFDFIATGTFTLDSFSQSKSQGSLPDGTLAGTNNDYSIDCQEGCCPGPNLIRNGSFQGGNDGSFTSAYTHEPGPYLTGAVTPGEYAVLDATQSNTVSSAWLATNASSCSTSGKYLAVNGATGQTGTKVAWSQTVPVVPGKEYRFCGYVRNLPQCAFDVKPRVAVTFSSPPNTTAPVVVNASASNACDWTRIDRTVVIPANVVLLTIEIRLDETGSGDGNDLAIDELSLQEMQPAPQSFVQVNIASANLTATTYEMTATPPAQPFSHYWEVCEVNSAGACIAATQVVNPPKWFPLGPNNFAGYNQGTFNASSTTPGTFTIGKNYMIRYGVFALCTRFTDSRWFFRFEYGAARVRIADSLAGL